MQGAQLLDGVDAVVPEEVLAGREHVPYLFDGTGRALAVGAPRDPADVRQARQGLEAAADQVEAVDADLLRGVGQRERQDEGAQQGRLAGLRAADDGGVAARDGQVEVPLALPLLRRVVEQAERHRETAAPPGELHAARADVQRAGDRVQRDRVGQRRQPDAAHLPGGVLQLLDDDAQLGRPGLAAPGRGLLRARAVRLGQGVEGLVREGEGSAVLVLRAPYRAPVGAGHVARLEALVVAGVDLEVAETGQRRQVEGVRGVQDRTGLVGGEGAQAQAVREVRVQALELAALDALAGQQQVDADGAADPADGEEQVDEVGLGREQFAELVDDDEEVRERVQVGPAVGAQRGVVADVGDVARVLEDLLAALDLAGERGVDALDETGLVLQVGDDPGDVRQVRERREGRTALVVDEDQGEVLRRVSGHQGEDEGAQELGLAGAGGADAQAVRAHAQLGGFLQVQQHGLVGVADADGHAQVGALSARGPQARQVQPGHVVDAEQVGEVHGAGQRGVDEGLGRQPQRGQHPGQALGEGDADLVHDAVGADGLLLAQVLDDHLVAVDGDPYADVPRLLDPLFEQVEDGDAHLAQADRVVGARQIDGVLTVAVGHDEQPGRHGQRVPAGQSAAHLGGVGGAAAQFGADLPGELGRGGSDPAGGDGAVELLGVEQVRHPLGPFPVGEPVAGDGQRDRHVVGGVQGGGLDQQGAGDAQAVLAGADDADVADAVERDGEREFGAVAEAGHQRRGLVEHELVGRGEDGGALLADLQIAYGHLAGADPHAQEVAVDPAALPQPGRVADDVVQGVGRRVEHVGVLPALAFLAGEFLAQVLQVGEIGLALGTAGALCLAALREDQCQGADDGDDEDQRTERGELAVADDRHHHDGRHDAGHGQQRHRDVARLPLGEVGRCLDGAGGGRGRGPDGPGRAVDQSGAHRRRSPITCGRVTVGLVTVGLGISVSGASGRAGRPPPRAGRRSSWSSGRGVRYGWGRRPPGGGRTAGRGRPSRWPPGCGPPWRGRSPSAGPAR